MLNPSVPHRCLCHQRGSDQAQYVQAHPGGDRQEYHQDDRFQDDHPDSRPQLGPERDPAWWTERAQTQAGAGRVRPQSAPSRSSGREQCAGVLTAHPQVGGMELQFLLVSLEGIWLLKFAVNRTALTRVQCCITVLYLSSNYFDEAHSFYEQITMFKAKSCCCRTRVCMETWMLSVTST